MYGGLKKSASRLALVAAAGVLSTSAYAADLGGDCCADLEERVAELEATTARKGTRKTSLEIYGLVNQAMTGWSDGTRSNMTAAYGNHNLQTRFGLRGNAKISPSTSAGYSIVIDVADKGRTSTFTQTQDIGSSKFAGGGVGGGASRAGEDYAIRMRDANWWIESAALGRITAGRITSEVAVGSPDIGGIAHAVGDDLGCNGGGLQYRTSAGALSGKTVGGYTSGCGGPWANRMQGLKYQSPTLAGFQLVATYGGNIKNEGLNVDSTAANAALAGNELGIGLRYAGEFSGIRVAANGGYVMDKNFRELGVTGTNSADTTLTLGGALGVAGSYASSDSRLLNVGLGLMHVPTGIFAQGEYSKLSVNQQNPANLAVSAGSRDATRYHITAGITQNWFGIGKTAFYAEYQKSENFLYTYGVYTVSGAGCAAVTYASTCNFSNGATAALSANVSGDSQRVWGLGFNQAIDAAAMDLYINYRNVKATDPNLAAGVTLKDVSIVTTGARIRF